jgi:hypothetical protein
MVLSVPIRPLILYNVQIHCTTHLPYNNFQCLNPPSYNIQCANSLRYILSEQCFSLSRPALVQYTICKSILLSISPHDAHLVEESKDTRILVTDQLVRSRNSLNNREDINTVALCWRPRLLIILLLHRRQDFTLSQSRSSLPVT